LAVAVCCLGVWAADKDQPPALENKVEPDWGDLTAGYLVDLVDVELAVLPSGEPFSLAAKQGSVPDPVVRALKQWRFSAYKKNGRPIGFAMAVKVPVRHKLDSDMEQSQRPVWHLPAELNDAIKLGYDLDPAKAALMQSNLPNGEAQENLRTSLLSYYAEKGAGDLQTARKARRDLITWLIHSYPQDGILASPYAMVNAAGEPLADSEGSALVKKEWFAAVSQYPQDDVVTEGAVSFLRIADPASAWRIVTERRDWLKRSNWLGNIAAFGGLGVTALAPASGAAVATSSAKLSEDGLAVSFRKALLQSQDLKVVLSGLVTITQAGSDLAARQALPSGYDDYCRDLLKHAHDLYSGTSLNCDLKPAGMKDPALRMVRVGGNVAEARLVKKVQPRYPQAAKDRHIQGTVEFTATISAEGHIQHLELVKAPFALYDASLDAVRQWEYQPTTINGKPVAVITDIVVNYTLQ